MIGVRFIDEVSIRDMPSSTLFKPTAAAAERPFWGANGPNYGGLEGTVLVFHPDLAEYRNAYFLGMGRWS